MKLKLFRYNIPFTEPFRTASGVFKNRTGILIQLKKNKITALGEASPLPGFSRESLMQVVDKIQAHKKDIQTYFASSFTLDSTFAFLKKFDSVPSLQFGLFTLSATFLAQQKESSLQQLLFKTDNTSVPVNAVLGAGSRNRLNMINQFVKNGYNTIKLKVDTNFPAFLNLVENIRSQYPELNIRVDANQSWPLDDAISYLSRLRPYQIEYCEEPLQNPDIKSIQELTEHCSTPIALDESVFQHFTISQSFELAPIIICKPMIWGLNYMNDEIKNLADRFETKLVFTTSLESSIGRLMTAALAAGMGNKTLAHGLDTGQMLANDVWTDEQFIKNGHFHLPDAEQLKELMDSELPDLNLQPI